MRVSHAAYFRSCLVPWVISLSPVTLWPPTLITVPHTHPAAAADPPASPSHLPHYVDPSTINVLCCPHTQAARGFPNKRRTGARTRAAQASPETWLLQRRRTNGMGILPGARVTTVSSGQFEQTRERGRGMGAGGGRGGRRRGRGRVGRATPREKAQGDAWVTRRSMPEAAGTRAPPFPHVNTHVDRVARCVVRSFSLAPIPTSATSRLSNSSRRRTKSSHGR